MDENNNPIQEEGVKTEENTQNVVVKKVNTMGLVSFIFSLVGLIIFGLPCGIVAVITGIMGLVKFNSVTEKCKGFAIAGLIIGIVDVIAVVANIIKQLASL